MKQSLEVRHFPVADRIELRTSAATGTAEFRGYATVYDQWYDVAGGPDAGGWREMVTAGAAQRTLNAKPDVRLLINHEGEPLARTKSGTLLLEEDERGLIATAPKLDLRDPDVQRIVYKMERGDMDEMSFAFRATRQEWNGEYTERRITEFALDVQGSDVSIVTYPANPYTVAQLRAAAKIDELRANAVCSKGMTLDMARAIATQVRVHA